MARVRVLVTKLGNAPIPKLAYSAEIFEDGDDQNPVWICVHEHRTPVEAQTCGIQRLTDRIVGFREEGVA